MKKVKVQPISTFFGSITMSLRYSGLLLRRHYDILASILNNYYDGSLPKLGISQGCQCSAVQRKSALFLLLFSENRKQRVKILSFILTNLSSHEYCYKSMFDNKHSLKKLVTVYIFRKMCTNLQVIHLYCF
jgi:hypothetical protein